MMETNRENKVIEQILFMLSMIMTIICTVWPVIQNIIESGSFFEREYLSEDFLNGFILILGSAYSRAMLGTILHPDILKDRKQYGNDEFFKISIL